MPSVGLRNQGSASSTRASGLSFLSAHGLSLLCPISELSVWRLHGEGSESLHFQINLRAMCRVDSVESGAEARWRDVSGDGDAMMG